MVSIPTFEPLETRQFGLISLATLAGSLIIWAFQNPAMPIQEAVPPGKIEITVTTDSRGRAFGNVIAEAGPWAPRNVKINAAGNDELQAIPGVGTSTAETILRERLRGGPFTSWENLGQRVPGIGPAKVAHMQQLGVQLGSGSMITP